jgi:hypothetical protein
MEERFQDPEIGVTQSGLFDAPAGVWGQGLKRFHEDEPEMDPRGIFHWSGSFSFHHKWFLDEKYIDVNIIEIKQRKLT